MDFKREFRLVLIIYTISKAAFANEIQTDSSSRLIPCEDGWFYFGEKCYKVFGEGNRLNWKQASTFCNVKYGNLVTVETKELQHFLTAFLLLHVKTNLWIGLHDRAEESEYMWDDNTTVSYTNWGPGEPTQHKDTREDCVEMIFKSKGKAGMWNDVICEASLPFICQTNKSEKAWSPDYRFCSAEKGGGWKYFNSCYHIIPEEKSFDDAENYCQENFRGHLLTVLNSKAEWYLNYILSNFTKESWIGIKIRDKRQQKWSSGWFVAYHKWTNEHKHFIKGTCAVRSPQQTWTFAPCYQKLPFICESSTDKPPVLQKGPEGGKCPNQSRDWIDLEGDSCYIFESKDFLKWHEANYVCMKKGGFLATIRSAEESNALQPHVMEVSENTLIGLHRSIWKHDVFEWSDGTNITYQNWHPGEPNSIKEKCGEIFTDTMKWNDANCDTGRPYICSAKKVPPVLMEKNETAVGGKRLQEQPTCIDGIPLKTLLIALVCLIIVSFLISIIIYKLKAYCEKKRKSYSSKNAASASFPNYSDTCEITLNPE